MPDHVVVYKSKQDQDWRWKRISANGEPLSSSTEGYVRKDHAIEQAYQLNGGVDDVRVEDGPEADVE